MPGILGLLVAAILVIVFIIVAAKLIFFAIALAAGVFVYFLAEKLVGRGR